MSIEGRVRESLRRELHASHPLVIDGDHDLDGCWALDRAVADDGRATAVQRVLDEVHRVPVQRATVAIAARMAEHLQRYRWPADLVVAPVPSHDPVVEMLARAIAFHLEVPCRPLLKLRAATVGLPPDRRITARARAVPPHVLLIDDRLSSGRTLRSCAWLLRDRGAQAVWAMVAAADVRTEVGQEPSDGAVVRERGEFVDVWNDLADDERLPPVLTPPSDVDGADVVEVAAHEQHAADGVVAELGATDDPDPEETADEVIAVMDDEVRAAALTDTVDDSVPVPGDADRNDDVEDDVEADGSAARAHRQRPKRRNRRTHRW